MSKIFALKKEKKINSSLGGMWVKSPMGTNSFVAVQDGVHTHEEINGSQKHHASILCAATHVGARGIQNVWLF